jgi:hypothetical protein
MAEFHPTMETRWMCGSVFGIFFFFFFFSSIGGKPNSELGDLDLRFSIWPLTDVQDRCGVTGSAVLFCSFDP